MKQESITGKNQEELVAMLLNAANHLGEESASLCISLAALSFEGDEEPAEASIVHSI